MGLLVGKVAVITGGTRGLGLGIARAMAAEGAAVVVSSRSPAGVECAVNALKEEGFRAAGLAADVSSLAQVEALAACALKTFGRLDIWVNNAGTAGPYGPTLAFNPEVFYRVMQTNMTGVYHGSRTAMRHFLEQGSGKLINVLGHGYNGPVAWQNAYSASKAWVRSFTLALARETQGRGVGVFAFNPGMVLTELLTDVEVFEGSEDRLKVFPTIVRMWAKPVEVPARKAAWIASSATDGQTGKLISIFSPWTMLAGALTEGWRRVTGSSARESDIKIKTIPPFNS